MVKDDIDLMRHRVRMNNPTSHHGLVSLTPGLLSPLGLRDARLGLFALVRKEISCRVWKDAKS
jgi:hypothetical protein